MAHYEFSQPKIILIRTQVLVQPSLYILRLAAINVCETDFKVVQRAAVANRVDTGDSFTLGDQRWGGLGSPAHHVKFTNGVGTGLPTAA